MASEEMYQDAADANDSKHNVRLSQRDLRAARRLLTLLTQGTSSDIDLTELPAEAAGVPTSPARFTRARAEFENRRRRKSFFPSPLFGEPAWDMLLALYILDTAGPRQTVGTLTQFSGTSTSSAKRWLRALARYGLVRHEDHPTDARTYHVRLTDKARAALDSYFSGAANASVRTGT